MRFLSAWLLASALLVAAAPSWADDVDPGPSRTRVTEPSPPEPHENAAPRGHSKRPVFLGLLAAVVLIIGAAAGANDKPSNKPTA